MRRVKAAPRHGLFYEVKYEKNVVYVFERFMRERKRSIRSIWRHFAP